jgi:hypothetical protein
MFTCSQRRLKYLAVNLLPDEGYPRNALCALNLISTFLLLVFFSIVIFLVLLHIISIFFMTLIFNKGNTNITELRTIFQRESQNS